jgi:dihydroxy-acid dehydratase
MGANLRSKADVQRLLPGCAICAESANLRPIGRYLAKHVCQGLHVPLPARTLLERGCVTGPTVIETLPDQERNGDQCVVRPADQPHSATRGIVGLRSNRAPAQAVVKVAGLADLKATGSARFDGEQACGWTVKKKEYREGEVLVIRYAGPQGGSGMRDILAHGAFARKACHAAI